MALAADQRFDGTDQRIIQLMREGKVEQSAPVSTKEDTRIEPAPECRDFLLQRLLAERDRLPIETVAGQRKDVAFLVGGGKQHQRLICRQERLNLFASQRERVR